MKSMFEYQTTSYLRTKAVKWLHQWLHHMHVVTLVINRTRRIAKKPY